MFVMVYNLMFFSGLVGAVSYYNGQKYQFYFGEKTWVDARAHCYSMNAKLASPESAE